MNMFSITKEEVIRELKLITIRNRSFNPDYWSVEEADELIKIGEFLKRELLRIVEY